MNRALITRRELVPLLLFLAAALAVWYGLSCLPSGGEVTVEQNGAVVYRQALGEIEEPVRLEVAGESGETVVVEIDRTGAAIVASACPDQVCVHTGRITRAGESSICLPERVSVRLSGGGADAVTGSVRRIFDRREDLQG